MGEYILSEMVNWCVWISWLDHDLKMFLISIVSALSLLLWDFLIAFPNEVRHIWRYVQYHTMMQFLKCRILYSSRPFNAVKIVYILSRYLALLVQT